VSARKPGRWGPGHHLDVARGHPSLPRAAVRVLEVARAVRVHVRDDGHAVGPLRPEARADEPGMRQHAAHPAAAPPDVYLRALGDGIRAASGRLGVNDFDAAACHNAS
jgi:hypothetical protein